MRRIAIVIMLLTANLALAQELPRIIVFGNKSMKPEIFVHLTGLDDSPEMSADEVMQHLQTTGLFSSVEVYRQDDIVTIYVREKTTWFIVPYGSKDSAASLFGVAFGMATIYGNDAKIMGRYQVGTGDHEGSLLVKDSSFWNTRWSLGGSFDFENALHRIFGGPTGREVVHRTLNQYIGGSFQVGYKLNPYWHLGLNNYMEQHRYEELNGEFIKGLQWSHKLMIEFNKFYVNEGLSDGYMSQGYVESTNPASDFQFQKYGGATQFGAFRQGNFNWIVRGRAEFSPKLPRYQLFELGGGRLRSFPNQQFRDRYYGTVQNDVLLTSVNFWMLRLRPLVYADWGYIQHGGHTGLGGGFQIYVRDVAIPAVQVFMGYGFHPDGFAVAAAIGPNI